MNSVKNMSKLEKEEFISNDLIERMIKIEQKISAKFHKPLNYEETEYYKSLTNPQRNSFEKYLKKKDVRKGIFASILFLSLILVFVLNSNITGNVIGERINYENMRVLSKVFVVLFLVGLIGAVLNFFKLKRTKKKYKDNFNVLENLAYKK